MSKRLTRMSPTRTKPELGIVSGKEIKAIRPLSNSEYKKYKEATFHLLRFSNDQQIFRIVWLNYNDFENLLKRYLEEYTKDPSMGYPRIEEMILQTNRHILNFLSSIRTFLDHSETSLKRRYGRNSKKVKHFKNACSDTYDKSFSYRFLYNLRNYAQHCGMPLGQLALHSKATGPDSENVVHSLAVKFNRDELLRKYDRWGQQLTEEIQGLPPTFEINRHVAEIMKCIERIELTLIKNELPRLMKNARYLQQLIAETKGMLGTTCILTPKNVKRSVKGKVVRLELNIEWLPLHLIEMVLHPTRTKSAQQKTLI